MKAAVLYDYGVPVLDEFIEPQASADAAVVDVTAAGLNPLDLAIAGGSVPQLAPRLPFVGGQEGVGVHDGRRVYFGSTIAPFGSFAERALVDPRALVDLADEISDPIALEFGIAGLAGWLALSWRARLRPGEHVLVLGTGSVGRVALQAARLLGAGRVVGASRSLEGLERARQLGCDAQVLLDADDERLASQVRRACGSRLDVVVDSLWGWPAAAALGALTQGGRLVQVGGSVGDSLELAPASLRPRLASILAFSHLSVPAEIRARTQVEMCRRALRGELRTDTELVGLAAVGDAFERQRRGVRKKLVLIP